MNELNDLCSWKHGHLMEVSRNPLKSHWSSCGLCGFLQVQKQHWGLLTWASWRRYVWMHACSQWQCIYTSTQFVAQRSSRTKPKPKPKKKMTPMLPLRVGLSLYVISKHVWRELRSLEDYCLFSKLNTFEWAQTSLSQRQLPRSPIGWLKISGLPKFTHYVQDKQWEESGWWALGVASHLPNRVGY